jgi:outer membrane protein assembly factor BamD (BamD/ComL family)
VRGISKAAPAAPSNDESAAPPAEPAPEVHAASRLREESAAVVAAREKLLSGDPVGALRMLDRLRADFPNGALGQEREALTVRALVESGQKEAARKRGEAFLRAFPRSPHAAEVRALLHRAD